MAFLRLEGSRHQAQPTNLFLFVYGDGGKSYFAYTDAEQAITSGIDGDGDPIVYQPVPISRGSYTSSGTLDKSTIEIGIPQDLPLAELFRVYPPSQVVSLIIYQGHTNDPEGEYLACWSGRVLSCSREDNEAKLSCEPISTTMKRPGLRRPYQYGCPHVLYGSECRANKSAATRTVTPIAIDGTVLTLPTNFDLTARKPKYLGGMVRWVSDGDTVLRTILRVTGANSNVLSLSGVISGLAAGAPVSVTLGCNHQAGVGPQPNGDCHPLHNNIQNFGGQMWIPTKNPIGLRNQYW
jgi:hypothetical protein